MLARRGYNAPHVLSRLLLEAFLFEDGRIASETFIDAGVCERGKFSIVRKKLQTEGFIFFNEDSLRHSKYIAGRRIKPYLDTLKTKFYATADQVKELDDKIALKADKSELKAVQAVADELIERMGRIEETVRELKAASEPPDNEEKKNRRKVATDRLTKLALVNSN
jgi:hypothetical protein